MKKFIVKLFLFGCFIYGAAWGLDWIISQGLLQMEDYRFLSWHEMQEGEANADIVIMGNSRALSHFDPITIESITGLKSYNLGLGGYAITVELLKYYCYRLHNHKPQYIIQQVDYSTIRNDKAPHCHQSEQFLPLIYDGPMRKKLMEVGYSALDVYFPLYRYFGYQMIIKNGLFEFLGIKHYVNDPSERGRHFERGSWNGTELARMDTIQAEMDPIAQKVFEKYLKECQDEKIKIILVNSPTYIGANQKTKGLDEVNLYFDSIAHIYDGVYLNYNEGYALCNDTSNFCVSVHLNAEAAQKFSSDFAHDLLDLGILQIP
jgi:hypothetical protein